MTKKILKLSVAALLLSAGTIFAADKKADTPAEKQKTGTEENVSIKYSGTNSMPFYGIGRGIFTIVQSPAELGRKTWLFWDESYSKNGAVAGTFCLPITTTGGMILGCFTMLGRCALGVADIMFLGLIGEMYSWETLPPFIWESPWTWKQEEEFNRKCAILQKKKMEAMRKATKAILKANVDMLDQLDDISNSQTDPRTQKLKQMQTLQKLIIQNQVLGK